MSAVDRLVRQLHTIVDARIALAQRASLEAIRGTVTETIPSVRLAMVRLDGGSTAIPVACPALPVALAAGDEVVVQRRRDGWLMVSDVLGRDAVSIEADLLARVGSGDSAPIAGEILVGTGASTSEWLPRALPHDHSSALHGATLAVAGGLNVSSAITPGAILADQTSYAPNGGDTAFLWRLTGNGAARTIHGIRAPTVPGAVHWIYWDDSVPLTLKHNSGSAVAGDRFLLPNAVDLVLAYAGESVIIHHDPVTGHWHSTPATPTTSSIGGAPSTADYLVGTAQAGLSGEIAVGTSPGGELGGTWASPTVDATHSGSAHHTQSHDHSAAGDGTALAPATLGVGAAAQRKLYVEESASTQVAWVRATHAAYASEVLVVTADRAASSAYYLVRCDSGGLGGDNEFLVRGDGAVTADGTYTTPADYAEFFETESGTSISPGVTVVLEGDRVRPAEDRDRPQDIIGVVRPVGSSAVIGNAAWGRWMGKQLRDDYGAPILDEMGDRIVSPDHDPERAYIPREERPEWVIVGLLGQVAISNGQLVGDRWVRMGTVSDTVTMWLVR